MSKTEKVDTRALQAFRDMWTPVMATLPAVIDAAQRSDDLDRANAAKLAEFQALEAKIAEKTADDERRVKVLQERLATLRAEHEAAVATTKEELKAKRAEVKTKVAAEEKKVELAEAAATDAAARLAAVQSELAAARAKIDEEVEAHRAALRAETEELVKRRDDAQKALDKLLSKFTAA